MTDAEAYESYHARQDEESYRRQLFLLGAAFGNPQIAKKLGEHTLSNANLQDALDQIAGRKVLGVSDYVSYLAHRELGIHECKKDATPLSLLALVAHHCRADSEIQRTLMGIGKQYLKLEHVRHKTVGEKREAVRRGKQIVTELQKTFEGLVNAKDGAEARHEASQEESDEAGHEATQGQDDRPK